LIKYYVSVVVTTVAINVTVAIKHFGLGFLVTVIIGDVNAVLNAVADIRKTVGGEAQCR